MTAFVRSTDVPDWMAEAVARQKHDRGCGSFDGGKNRAVPAERFAGQHRDHDMVWASVHIADVCNGLGVTIATLAEAAKQTPSSARRLARLPQDTP